MDDEAARTVSQRLKLPELEEMRVMLRSLQINEALGALAILMADQVHRVDDFAKRRACAFVALEAFMKNLQIEEQAR